MYDSGYLCERDKTEFADYLILHELEDKVLFCVADQEIKPVAGELFTVDESDARIFGDPSRFMEFTSSVACLCFTATPDDEKVGGPEVNVNKNFSSG